jgi:threonine/homoserine/homoserine lactone efflux protein
MDEHDTYRRRRETFLSVFLAAVVLIGLLFVFTILTGGFLIYVLAAVLGLVVVGGMHYLLWGQAYTERTAGEREELEAQERAAADEEGFFDETRRPRHY